MTNRYNELNAKDQAAIDELINALASSPPDGINFRLIVKRATLAIQKHGSYLCSTPGARLLADSAMW